MSSNRASHIKQDSQFSSRLKKSSEDAFRFDFGDFCFIKIRPKLVHFVSRVATALLGSGDFNAEEFGAAKVDPISQFSVPISSHMNKDRSENTKAIVEHSTSIKVDFAYILDMNNLGFNIKISATK
ncbi:hypothetical protein KFK09_007295 [Dendrobium nobile]|uniref:DUF2470 domain-containing protein n=1 Tax=Dendrobium nobile TaxID=94219 RepID=A0A8T3BWP4_DENNO|nr:hypothetical protein KFK09_007295 [Dendrobium nobile]